MIILEEKIAKERLAVIAEECFGDMVKAVVDLNRGILAINAELHSDLEAMLLENGSKQDDLWGLNLYPGLDEKDFIEFDSLINIRPRQGNRSRGIDNEDLRKKATEVVYQWIEK